MFVKVCGKKVEVSVSDSGMFYDSATKKVSAPTLKGLTKKLTDRVLPTTGIVVETKDGRKGTVLGRVKGRSWTKNNWVVRWEDGTQTSEYYPKYFIRPLTDSERGKLAELRAKVVEKQAIVTEKQEDLAKAQDKVTEYLQPFSLESLLDAAYPSV